ncbi:MAG: polyphosphate--AMP phosphotransferase [Proteobacteria bacterium]|nr:MAG: polyphosphate--AMP phosphotransferase [Pseudomonadota bacterium]
MRGIRFDEPGKVKLSAIDTEPKKGIAREDGEARLAELGEELFELQALMWGAKTHSLLLVLQGRDAAGKDGTVKDVLGHLNPRGVRVASFGVPSKEERAHDFLWRIHRQAPMHGCIVAFNRSHYEDVLVVRVHKLAPPKVWKARYAHINSFEAGLAEAGTIIVKCFLHISKKEQEERLYAREEKDYKAWKLNAGDWRERRHWRAYTRAYEDAIGRCAQRRAPWVVVPADKKWYRNVVVADALVEALRPFKGRWEKTLERIGIEGRAELAAYRESLAADRLS